MPTGYTATLCEKGQDFRAFALNCAHAFGACVSLRDDAPGEDIPEFKPSDCCLNALKDAKAKLRKVNAMDEAARLKHGERLRKQKVAMYERLIAERVVQNRRLAEMKITVESWSPPTQEHAGLKAFMLEQINTSYDDTSYWADLLEDAKRMTPEEYASKNASELARSVVSLADDHNKEVGRVNDRNAWVKALKASLPK